MIFRDRNILTWFLKVKKILVEFLEFWSDWLRLITLCENFAVFWVSGPDCREFKITVVGFVLKTLFTYFEMLIASYALHCVDGCCFEFYLF